MRLFERLLPSLLERRVRKTLSGADAETALRAVVERWAVADVVHRGPVGYSPTLYFEYRILLEFLTLWGESAASLLQDNLADSRDIVVAYSLVALGAIGVGIEPSRFDHRVQPIPWRLC